MSQNNFCCVYNKQIKMISGNNSTLEKSCDEFLSQGKERLSNTTNDSQALRLSVSSDEIPPNFENNLFYKKFFQQKIKQPQITLSLHKKAINWLITFCWTRNYSSEILWYSTGYYYAYFYSTVIKKERLTLVLISAVNLALKLFESDSVMGFESMKTSLNNAFTIHDFINTERQFLEVFEYDLYFPTILVDVLTLKITEDEKFKILFIAECLLMNNFQVAINDIVLEDIQLILNRSEIVKDFKLEIKKVVNQAKFIDILKQKFSSKFNVDRFLQEVFDKM